MNEERLVEIETKIAFQENIIKELNDVVCKQQMEIDKINAICKVLLNRNSESSGISSGINPKDEKPPHY